jgi:hypothetical protein
VGRSADTESVSDFQTVGLSDFFAGVHISGSIAGFQAKKIVHRI